MNNLKRKRTEAGITQAQLAEASQTNVRMIQHYEQGFKDINKAEAETVLRIADALQCDIREILNKAGE